MSAAVQLLGTKARAALFGLGTGLLTGALGVDPAIAVSAFLLLGFALVAWSRP